MVSRQTRQMISPLSVLTVVIKGGGDLATGVAHRLHRAGMRLIITELPQPLVIRRTVAFASTVFEGETSVTNAKVKVAFLDASGGLITALTDWTCPRGSQSYHLSLVANPSTSSGRRLPGQWVGSARVESQAWFTAGPVEYSARQPSPWDSVFHGAGSLPVSAPNILSVAELVRHSGPARATALEAIAYPLLTEGRSLRPVCVRARTDRLAAGGIHRPGHLELHPPRLQRLDSDQRHRLGAPRLRCSWHPPSPPLGGQPPEGGQGG